MANTKNITKLNLHIKSISLRGSMLSLSETSIRLQEAINNTKDIQTLKGFEEIKSTGKNANAIPTVSELDKSI